jgi:predicted PurR-regulated permease PerM
MDVPEAEAGSASRHGWTRRRIVFLSVSAVAIVGILLFAAEVLLPFVLAIIIAYVLTPLVALCERIRIPRALAILTVYAATFSVVYGFWAMVAPRVYFEGAKLVRDTPTLMRNLSTYWTPRVEGWVHTIANRTQNPSEESGPKQPAIEVSPRPDGSFGIDLRSGVDLVKESTTHWRIVPVQDESPEKFSVNRLADESVERLVGYVQRNVLEVLRLGQALVSSVLRAVVLLFLTLMVAGYIMHTRESILGFFRSLPPPEARPSFDRLLHRIDRGLAGVVRGQLFICVVNGILSAIGFWFLGVKYWPILAIVAGAMSIIPIFGSILSSVPVVLIGLTQSFWIGFWLLIWIIGIHQVEANFLNPKIIGVAAKIHPVLVVFALVLGEHTYGLWGALLAVPTLSLAQSFFLHFREVAVPEPAPEATLAVPAPVPAAEEPARDAVIP